MKTKGVRLIGTGLLGLAALAQPVLSDRASAQEHKPLMIHRLYTGPDGQTHAEEIEAKFAGGGGNDVHKLMANSGAELHRAPPGRVADWHVAPRRQYVITPVTPSWRSPEARRLNSGPGASISSKTPPARVTSPERSAPKIG